MYNPTAVLRSSSFLMLLTLLISLGFSACTSKEGCTDCNANNYDPKADEDDGSCTYYSDRFVGTYLVHDSVVDPFQSVFRDTFEMDITQVCDNRNNITISNLSGAPLNQLIQVNGDSLCIVNSNGDCLPGSNGGYLINGDSIMIRVSWTGSFGDPYYSVIRGRKK